MMQGFDEFMNTVLDDAVEVCLKGGKKRPIGRICLKGDNIALICNISTEWVSFSLLTKKKMKL